GADGPGALVRDLPPRLPRLRRLPGGHGRRRRRGAGAGAHPRPGGRGARHPARPRGPRRDRGQPLRPHRGHLRGPGPVLDPGAGRPGRRPGGGAHPHRRARPRRSAPVRTAAVLMSTTDTDAQRAPVPPGWPGDDPTLPDDFDALGARWWWWVGRRTRGRRVGALEGPGSRSSDADRTGERAAEGDGDDWPADDVAVADDELDLDDDPGGAGPRWTDRFRWRGSPPEGREPPDDDEPLPVDDDDLVAGVQPAGRVLVVLVATLVLALLVNVDDLVARVEAQPPGPARDRTLAVLHPVQDVGNALQLTRIRDALDALSGDGGDGPAATGRDGARRQDGDRAAPRGDGGDEPAGDGEGEEGTERDDGPRAPTPDDPLRVWVGGDFMAQAIGRSLAAAGDATGVVETEVRYEAASGLTRRDYFDWPAAVEEALDEHDPEVVVLVLGVNDAQGIVRPDGTPAQVDEPGWADEYGRRVG